MATATVERGSILKHHKIIHSRGMKLTTDKDNTRRHILMKIHITKKKFKH